MRGDSVSIGGGDGGGGDGGGDGGGGEGGGGDGAEIASTVTTGADARVTVTPRVDESNEVDDRASVLDALAAAALVGMINRMVTVMLPAVKVMTASLASENRLSRADRTPSSSKELTSPATVSCIVTTGT